MDKLANYREIVRSIIFRYSNHRIANGQIEGIPKEEIVLGVHPENIRQHTGFAIC